MSRGSRKLEAAGMGRDEAEALAVSERGTGLTIGGGAERTSLGYLHTVHPDTGNEVVFVPGEALPDWAVKVQNDHRVAERLRPAPRVAEGRRSVKSGGGKA